MSDLCERVSTFFGVGRLPGAPGTWGSAAGVLVHLASRRVVSVYLEALFISVLFCLGAVCSGVYSDRVGVGDPREVVVDEVAGMMAALVPFGLDAGSILLSFGAFRVFDILKPPPIRSLERAVGGGLGIMLDDLLAALYTVLTVFVIRGVFGA